MPQRLPTDWRYYLTQEQVSDLVNAVAFSHSTGHPLIAKLTVIWAHFSEFTEDRLGSLTTRFFDLIGKWLRRRGIAFRAAWTRERGQQKGHHLHALTNIPIRHLRDMEVYLRQTFRISHGGLDFSYGRYGMRTLPMQMGALRYVCKALDHRAFKYFGYNTVNIADALGIQHTGTGGPIHVKRAGCTTNIGSTARRRAHWRELRHIDELAQALNPTTSKQGGRLRG